jgi:hypothetical protein
MSSTVHELGVEVPLLPMQQMQAAGATGSCSPWVQSTLHGCLQFPLSQLCRERLGALLPCGVAALLAETVRLCETRAEKTKNEIATMEDLTREEKATAVCRCVTAKISDQPNVEDEGKKVISPTFPFREYEK